MSEKPFVCQGCGAELENASTPHNAIDCWKHNAERRNAAFIRYDGKGLVVRALEIVTSLEAQIAEFASDWKYNFEQFGAERDHLIAAVAGMRDKWTPPDDVAKLQAKIEALEKQLKWEKALTVAHSDKITWLERVINVMLPLTPFADAEDALLTGDG